MFVYTDKCCNDKNHISQFYIFNLTAENEKDVYVILVYCIIQHVDVYKPPGILNQAAKSYI
jgi:hypothetical protein